jgi:hypothetical protein
LVSHGAITRTGYFLVLFTGCHRFLLKTMQDLHRFLELGDIDHSIDATAIPHSNFLGASANFIMHPSRINFYTNKQDQI